MLIFVRAERRTTCVGGVECGDNVSEDGQRDLHTSSFSREDTKENDKKKAADFLIVNLGTSVP